MSPNCYIFTGYIVKIIHYGIVLFVIVTPFTKKSDLLLIHSVFSTNMLLHWHLNDQKCILTAIERKLLGTENLEGVKDTEGFIEKIIKPIYNFKNRNIDIDKIIYGTVSCLTAISFYRWFS